MSKRNIDALGFNLRRGAIDDGYAAAIAKLSNNKLVKSVNQVLEVNAVLHEHKETSWAKQRIPISQQKLIVLQAELEKRGCR